MFPENLSDDGDENVGLGSLLEGTEVFNFMEKISSTLSYWTKREAPQIKQEKTTQLDKKESFNTALHSARSPSD